jgi:hypothetical protein
VIVQLAAVVFLCTVGMIMGDVMADSLVVERGKFEEEGSKGQMQASCYAIRYANAQIHVCRGRYKTNGIISISPRANMIGAAIPQLPSQ